MAKIVVVTRRLRWSSPLLFNDPFDITQELRLDFTQEEFNTALAKRWAAILESGDASQVQHPAVGFALDIAMRFPADVRSQMAEEIRAMNSAATHGQIRAMEMLKSMWKEMVPTFRIICFSEINDATPMWLHYADKYKGVVLEFTAVDEVDSPLLVARPVIYQDSPPRIASVDTWVEHTLHMPGTDYRNLFSELQYVKTSAWAYEREWRVVSHARPGESGLFSDWGFFESELTGIYFGPQCPLAERRDLLAMRTHGLEHVRAYEAVPSVSQARFEFRLTP